MKIALAQISSVQEKQTNIEKGIEYLRKAAQKGAEAIFYPEMSFCRFFPQYQGNPEFFDWAEPVPGPTVEAFQKACAENSIAAIINVFEKGEPGRYYDCSPVIDSSGNYLGKSQMMHIAELPNYNEKYYYWEGKTDYPLFKCGSVKIGIAICYDRHYPEQMRILTLKGADMIVVPTATSLTDLKTIWETEMQAASVANQVYVAVVNHVGIDDKIHYFGKSFVTGPQGNIISMAGDKDEELLIVDIDPCQIDRTRRILPFLRDRRPETYTDLIDLD